MVLKIVEEEIKITGIRILSSLVLKHRNFIAPIFFMGKLFDQSHTTKIIKKDCI